MRTTLNIDDSLLNDAARLTGVKEKTSLVRLGLEALIAKESARRLANLGGNREAPSPDSETTVQQDGMILVDTSVWIQHFRIGSERLKALLLDEQVLCHPLVVGELACGTLQKRAEILAMLKALPKARLLAQEEVLSFLEARCLYGRGIGWVDAHLLASTMLTGCSLWTIDKPLRRAAAGLDVLV